MPTRFVLASSGVLVGLLASGPLATSPGAQSPRPMTPEDVLAIRAVSDPQVSPDGRHVAYVVTEADLKKNERNADIWLVATAGGTPKRLTMHPKSDSQPRWSADGTMLAFVSAREEKPQIFVMSPFGGEPRKLTSSKAGVSSPAWAPDGTSIAFTAPDEPTEEDERRTRDKDDVQMVDEDHEFARIWTVNVASGAVAALVTGEFHASDPQWSPDGKRLAYVTTPTPKADDGGLTDVWVMDVASKATRKLVENEGPDGAPRWSPDGTQIALLSRDAEKGLLGQPRLVVAGAAGGAAPRVVAPGFLYQPSAPTWSADGRTIYFEAQTRTVDRLYAVPAAGGTPKAITDMAGTFAGSSIAPGGAVAVVATSFDKPAEIYASVSAAPVALKKLSDHNPQVAELSLGRSEVITWKSKDGLEVEGLLVYPVGYREGEKYPLIVNVHGGPSGIWANAFPASWGNYSHVWAGRGWAVLLPNPRGSSGYGEQFLLANVRDWGGGDYQDVQTGVDHLVAKGIADPDRLGQTGWSYGGYMTAWTLTQTDRFKAVMVGAGLTNMFSMYSTNDLQRLLEGYFGAEPWDDTEIYYTRSAMNFIKQAKTPTLIMHGAADLRVPLGQAQELYMGLKKNEVPVAMAVYPREPHGLQEPRHQLDKMTRELEWFAEHVIKKGGS